MKQEILEFPPLLFPSTDWFSQWLRADKKQIVTHWPWQKQSAFNRFYIDGPNGEQILTIPVVHPHQGASVDQIRISYHTDWRAVHLKTLHSVYNNSPFYEFLLNNLEDLYKQQPVYLIDFIISSIHLCLQWCKESSTDIITTLQTNNKQPIQFELKKGTIKHFQLIPYNQVFSYKNGFLSKLSVIDLIFNEGPHAKSHLIDI